MLLLRLFLRKARFLRCDRLEENEQKIQSIFENYITWGAGYMTLHKIAVRSYKLLILKIEKKRGVINSQK